MACLKPVNVNGTLRPCGVCRECRIRETTDWSLRCLYELNNWDYASFVTLTFKEEYNEDKSIHKKELKAFFDRLNHKIAYREEGRKIKYFGCGEYGTKRGRKHYHAIIFGLNPNPYDRNNHDREYVMESWKYCDPSMWTFRPHCECGDEEGNAIDFVNRKTIQYVAGYCQKKLKSFRGYEAYEKQGREPPFKLVSQGLGLDFCLKNADRLKANGYTYYNGHKVPIPRYFREKLGMINNPLDPRCDREWQESQFNYYENQKELFKTKNYLHQAEYKEQFEQLFEQFKGFCIRRGGQVDFDMIKNSGVIERLFNDYIDRQQFDIADMAERDFIRSCHLTRNKF